MVDYSKWKDIEISDDEDETHPNIDTPSLFRWRHQARVERMEERKQELDGFEKQKNTYEQRLKDVKDKLATAEKSGDSELEKIRKQAEELEKEGDEIKKKQAEIEKKEKKTPWNVDTISKAGFNKTVVNKKLNRVQDDNLTEEEREQRMKKFIRENEKDLKHYGMLRKYEDSKDFLKKHSQLVCEDTANYLVIWCINLEMEEKSELMAHVARQTICMQFILELAKQLDYDPRGCLDSFFTKIQVAEPEYKASFNDELYQFKERIRKRAAEKLEDALREVEEEERKARLGPGGLDPVEVFESLPEVLQKCFESQNVGQLQETIAKMDESEARYHMKRCVDSGLWVPEANKDKTDTEEAAPSRGDASTSTEKDT